MKHALWTVAAILLGVLQIALYLVLRVLGQTEMDILVKTGAFIVAIGLWYSIFKWLDNRAPTLRAAVVIRNAYWLILMGMVALAVVEEYGLVDGAMVVVIVVGAVVFYWENVGKPIRQLGERIAALEAQVAAPEKDGMPE